MTGLSLIELMISITIGLMILSGVAFVFVNTSSARNEVERTSRQIENGRYAVEVIADDLRLAGFYGELNVGSLTAPALLPTDQCSLTASDWNAWIPLHVQGFDNGTGFDKITTAACALADQKADTDILLIRRARTCLAGVSGCEAVASGKPYVQVSLCAPVAPAPPEATHKLGKEGTETFDLKKKACGTTVADKREYFVRIYYISTNNGSGQSIPTLKRLELGLSGGSLTWVTTPLVEGIEEFNVAYGLDTDGDGAPDSYSASPAATVAAWQSVVSVQLHILARSLEISPGYTDPKTYTIGIDAAGSPVTVAPGDGYRRHVYSGLVRLNNPAGRRDTP
jgi:type IV pilus assembly protein PilW